MVAKGKGHFTYKSVEMHTTMVNGHRNTRKNVVNVVNGKGVKKTEVLHNKKTRKNSKRLTKREIMNIRKRNFMPGFFKL